jgi:hypothetical protein
MLLLDYKVELEHTTLITHDFYDYVCAVRKKASWALPETPCSPTCLNRKGENIHGSFSHCGRVLV